uniref:Cadherin domain-containing protein n=1 Tax=Macrostomum lignano TaxID=282301 RepID=A0A1I8IRL3_9PLAT
MLRAAVSLDRETRATYQIRVEAADSGQPPRSAVVVIRVRVRDVNDNAPEFVGPRELALPENTEPPVVLGRLNATDADEGVNSQVLFTLVQPTPDSSPLFRVDPDGTVTVLRRLDREQLSQHHLTVRLADRGQPPKLTDAQLTVRVLDENDSPPRIVQPAPNSSAPAARISIYTHPPGK